MKINLPVKILFQLFLFSSAMLPLLQAEASEITIRPFLIDETLTPRQDAQNLVTIKSDYEHRKAILYATVNEISIDSEGDIKEFVTPVMTDRTNTVTSWIEISRARIEIPAGESREVPLTIRLHPHAEPGEYHVFIGFVEAPNRPKAEATAMAGDADGVIVKITVADEREDSMKITSFVIDRFVTNLESSVVSIDVENLGDIPSVPQGELIFYDSRGVEISSVPVRGDSVQPGETVTIHGEIPLSGELGRYKANLSLKYGENQAASLYDTTFFYLMPTHLMMALFGVILIISILVALLFRRIFMTDGEGHEFDDVTMYVRDGHEPDPKDHDINLKNE